MAYTPKHYYRAKDDLNTGDPNKRVRGSELSDEFEAISSDLRKVRDEINAEDSAINEINVEIDSIKVDVESNKTDINELREDFESHDHKLNDLSDVNASSPNRDDLISWNGAVWESGSFDFIESELTFQGGIDLTQSAPANPANGDLYISNNEGVVDSSWTGIAGQNVVEGKFVGWAETRARWYFLGDMADVGVTSVGGGLGISVDDSKPSEPVVSIDRDEVDKWYASYDDILWKQNGDDIYYNDGRVGIGGIPVSGSRRLMVTDTGDARVDIRSGTDANLGAIDFSDTSNTAIGKIVYDHDDDSMQLHTFSIERMRIDSSGNVGIGTDSPNSLLHVHKSEATASGIRMTNSITGSTALDGFEIYTVVDGSGYVRLRENSHMAFATNDTERMRIDSSGNVIIGHTLSYQSKDSNGDARTLIRKGPTDATEIVTSFGDEIHFKNGSVLSAIIDGSGRVGIGGTPGTRTIDEAKALAKAKLTAWKAEVKKRTAEQPEASTQEITLEVTDGDFGVMPTEQVLAEFLQERNIGGGDAKLQVAGSSYFNGTIEIQSQSNTACIEAYMPTTGVDRKAFILYSNNGSTKQEKVSLTAGGDGYFSGTVNATTINGTVTDVADHIKAITPTQIANWDAGTGGGGGATTDGRISDDQIIHWDQAYGWGNHADAGYQPAGNYLTSIASGNGTKVTGNKVEMSGSFTGSFTATGDIVAYSDVRLKENIQTLDGSKVFDMRGVSFDRDGKPSSGVIAQELREVAPELVHDDGEHLGVAYGNLVGYLIEAVKELKAEVEELKRG